MSLKTKSGSPLVIRPVQPAEINLIKSDWYRSFAEYAPERRKIRPDVFSTCLNGRIERLIERFPPVVAVFERVPDEVLGWVCREFARPVTHYVYVKRDFRRQGIASALVQSTMCYTHRTDAGSDLFRAVGALYNPFLLES